MRDRSTDFVVTGADGWLGRALLDTLFAPCRAGPAQSTCLRESKVRGLILSGDGQRDLQARWPELEVACGDLRHPEAATRLLKGMVDPIVIHTAGVIHPRRIRDFYTTNVDGTRNLLEAAAAAAARRVVVVSSNSPCGFNARPDDLFDENSPYEPYMHYGRSKMLMEIAARSISSRTGLDVVIVRAPWFYGPWQPERQTRFFRMIRDGRFPMVGSGLNRRSMAYTETLADGLVVAAITAAARGQTYWMADRRPYTMHEIIGTVRRLLTDEFGQKCRPTGMRLPGLVSDIARRLDAAIQFTGCYSQEIHVLSEMNLTIACSIDKAVQELGFDPRIDLEDGMRRSLRWILETHGKL